MNGLLVVDKPPGVTSFDVVRQVRRLTGTRRVGHAGTLDPMATGVLLVAIGWTTRLVEYLMAGEKTYLATMRLGCTTDSQDATGQVLAERPWQHVDRSMLPDVLARFSGEISQLPPMFSALKKDGQPLYKLARQGLEVPRAPRAVQIHSLTVATFAPPDVTFTVRCSKGTYVRTLCHDIGELLGCGACMTALRRLACGPFELSGSHTLGTLQAFSEQGRPLPLLSPAAALADWTPLSIEGPALQRLQTGVAPCMADLAGDEPAAGTRVKFLAGEALAAIALYAPGDTRKRPGDFEILKVFPLDDGT